MTLPARMLSALLDPGALAEGAGSRAWADVLLVSVLMIAAANLLFWNSGAGRRVFDDQRHATLERLRGRVPAETLEWIARAPAGYRQSAMSAAIGRSMNVLVPTLLWTALIHLTFSVLLLRPHVGFGAVLTIVGHASIIWAIGEILLLALTAADGVPRGATSPANLLPAAAWPPETSFAGALLARFDVFDLWWVPVVSIAVARLYGLKAWAVMASIGGLKLLLVLISAAFFRPPEGGAGTIGGHIL